MLFGCRVVAQLTNSNAYLLLLAGKEQEQAANKVYRCANIFFEKLRVKEEKPNSNVCLANEQKMGGAGTNPCSPSTPWLLRCVRGKALAGVVLQ